MTDPEHRDVPARRAEDPDGGDPACWAALLCQECGSVVEELPTATCLRCGAPLPEG
ncbi:hypothetical protein SAMN05661080_01433 [Modestobacter sp. DSM 44400]|uniref:hypothetical protein n=1 Tax=Modestobacter sp. DSM 44400 TaxID=1550230 RepID=UPI000896BA9A|nr:hypothetical protein [Modestobacter sp. DSM 44400]SDX84504.1 hypothetical protein SAMN05661080_01433 [Modestobacter sp. DSM 44400]